jgi:hypothetical protein
MGLWTQVFALLKFKAITSIIVFTPNNLVNDHHTRKSIMVHLMPIKPVLEHKIIIPEAIFEWNNSPKILIDTSNINTFKRGFNCV